MPYTWTDDENDVHSLELWPHRSLPPQGFALFFGVTALMFTVPLSTVLGTVVLWYILPFIVGTVSLMWLMLKRNYRDGELREVLTIAQDTMALIRHNPRRPVQHWQANPYWVRVAMHETGGPVENYVTLTGGGREVEIGAFLSPDEREALFEDLQRRLNALNINSH